MFYVVGLGNPGEKYEHTRHNVGFAVLSAIIEKAGLPDAVASAKYSGRVSEGVIAGVDVQCLFPDTYMNNSGTAVGKLVPKGEERQLVVIYDDVDLPIGTLRISFGRGAGGHNGVASIISSTGTKDFIRIRIGVAAKGFFGIARRPTGDKLSKHVLGTFSSRELRALPEVGEQAYAALCSILQDGIETAMNTYN